MSGLLFRFCFVRNTHAEQRWYQHHRIESYAEGQLYVGLFEVCDHGQNNV